MVQMFAAYRQDNDDVEFKIIHVFSRIDTCDKWAETRITLAKAKDAAYDPTAPA